MAAVLIGPCIVVAPFVILAMLLAIPLWPVAIVVVCAMWMLVWPLERVLRALGVRRFDGASAAVSRWLVVVVKPWSLFETVSPSARPAGHRGNGVE